jgi:hypothetical protein
MIPYPKKSNNEFIKIHHMTHNMFYTEDILLQYSTKLEPIIEVVEVNTQCKKSKKVSVVSISKTNQKNISKNTSKNKL